MRPLKLFRRADDRPSLKDRAAELRARLARITRRREAETDPQRRVMVAGTLAAAIPLPALARAAVTGPHPDQAVFEAEAAMLAAERAYITARNASSAARKAAWAEIGPCPRELLRDTDGDRIGSLWPGAPRHVQRDRCRFQFIDGVGEAWTADGLQRALCNAVADHGVGGRTPHRCRRYRALLPAAKAFDARRAAAEERYHVAALAAASRDAFDAYTAAQAALDATPATTPAGLAVIAQHVGECSPERMPANWRNLLASAANVSGVELPAARSVSA